MVSLSDHYRLCFLDFLPSYPRYSRPYYYYIYVGFSFLPNLALLSILKDKASFWLAPRPRGPAALDSSPTEGREGRNF